MDGKEMTMTPKRNVNDLPSDWDMERFTIIDAGGGQIALHNKRFNRFVRMDGSNEKQHQLLHMDVSRKSLAKKPDPAWIWERFTPVRVDR